MLGWTTQVMERVQGQPAAPTLHPIPAGREGGARDLTWAPHGSSHAPGVVKGNNSGSLISWQHHPGTRTGGKPGGDSHRTVGGGVGVVDLALCQSHFTLPLPPALLPSALIPKHSTHLFEDLPCARPS